MDYCLSGDDGAAAIWHGQPDLDLDHDGVPEAYFTGDGSGTWAVAADRGGGLRWYGLDGSCAPTRTA